MPFLRNGHAVLTEYTCRGDEFMSKKNKQKKVDTIVEEVTGTMTTDSEGNAVLVKDGDN